MKFKKYLEKEYISIVDKKEYKKAKDNKTNKLLNELNRFLDLNVDVDYKFSVADKNVSPSEVLQDNDKKTEIITRKWMHVCEEFEEIKKKAWL